MRKIMSVTVTLFLFILIASVLRAETRAASEIKDTSADREVQLVTPPLFVEGATTFFCTAVNLHPRAIQVDIRVFDQTGTNTCGVGPQRLEPGETAVQGCNGDIFTEFEPVRYCEITYTGQSGFVLGTAQFDPPSLALKGVGPAVAAVESATRKGAT